MAVREPDGSVLPLGKQLKIIHNAYEEQRNRQLLNYNLTSAQMDVLICLKHCGHTEIHQRELEQWLRLKNPTVTGILNRLEEKGLIVRKTREKDRRFRRIELTEESERLLEELRDEMWKMDDKLCRSLSEEEKQQLSLLLDKILAGLFGQ